MHENSLRGIGAVPAPLARLRRAPRLRGAVREAVVEIVRKEKDGAKERVADLVACELQHINTRHPAFAGGGHHKSGPSARPAWRTSVLPFANSDGYAGASVQASSADRASLLRPAAIASRASS